MEEKNKSNHYYISLPTQKREEDLIDFEIKMLEQNQIRGLLPAAREYQDTEAKIYFDISGRQNLEQRYAWQKLTGREVRQILHMIAEVAAELEEYMLDYNHLNLMPEFMYGMLDLKDLCFCYEPWDSETFGERLKALAMWFLDHMDYREREEVIFSYEFQRFCDENDVSLALLRQFMAEKQGKARARESGRSENPQGKETENAWKETGGGAEAEVPADDGSLLRDGAEERRTGQIWEEPRADPAWKKNGGMKELFRRIFPAGGRKYPDLPPVETLRFAEDETEYRRSYHKTFFNDTVPETDAAEEPAEGAAGKPAEGAAGKPVDGAAKESAEEPPEGSADGTVCAELISRTDLPAISIRKFPFFVGSDAELTDCAVPDDSVGRIHVRLFQADGCVWAEDLRSGNGTFINGDRMPPNEPWVLKNGDEIQIGACLYCFRGGT